MVLDSSLHSFCRVESRSREDDASTTDVPFISIEDMRARDLLVTTPQDLETSIRKAFVTGSDSFPCSSLSLEEQ